MMEMILEIPKKYVHSLTHFCRNNNYKFKFENMHSLPKEKVAKFAFREDEYFAAANSFLSRLIDLDRLQPDEEVDKKKPRPDKEKTNQ